MRMSVSRRNGLYPKSRALKGSRSSAIMSGEPAVAHLPLFVDHDPRNLPLDLLASIGLMAACASKTENVVEIALTGC